MSEPIMEIDEDGTKRWSLSGELHREDGPAIEYANGSKFWCRNGKLHREDGPAIELANGATLWYLNGNRYSKEEYTLISFFGVKDV